jgi:uncharacterized membrane protein YeaQ/YmgE (transglycosylase-associated protein family)
MGRRPSGVILPQDGYFSRGNITIGGLMAVIGSILWAFLIGGVIGAIARLIVPGKQNMSIGLTIVIGIVAALLGTLVAWLFGVSSTKGIDWIQWVLQIGFAVVGVFLVSNRR